MRFLLLATASLLAVVASAQEKWIESSVTLALTLSAAGEQTLTPRSNNTVTRVVPLVTSRLGNKDILDALVANGLLNETKGWRIVAIWAYWPDEDPVAGNTYRFYARKGKGATLQTVAIPSELLSVAPLVAAVGVRHSLQDQEDTILSGSESYKVYTKLNFAIADIFGDLHGVQTGAGKYVKVTGQSGGRYVPGSSKAPVNGLFSHDGENAAGVVAGSIAFGPGRFVTSYDYVAPSGTHTGAVSVSAGADFTGIGAVGTIHSIASADNIAISSGLITLAEGSTLNFGPSASVAGGTLTFSLESAGNLVAANGGTFQFLDGGSLILAPGATFDLSTLHGQQLGTSATFTFNPVDGTLTSTLAPDQTQATPTAP